MDMDDKFYFNVQNTDGIIEKMELLSKITNGDKNYILYKNCDENDIHYYAAKCDGYDENGFTNLDPNLSIEEKKFINDIFEKIELGDYDEKN